jgi:transglutaminase-like putative cysteine protease
MIRRVNSHLGIDVQTASRLVFQVAVADHDAAEVDETLTLTLDGAAVTPRQVLAPHGGRLHVYDSEPGRLELDYAAVVTGQADPAPLVESDEIVFLRASRYAESDRLGALARSEFAGLDDGALLAAVSSWVGTHLIYISGSSRGTDGAVDTLLAGQGVCRDFAHLVVALLRALDVPARVVAVYAPGLYPMDFHAVAEALIDGSWQVVDATLLAPRSSLVRIATGRDAADTAFLSSYHGKLVLTDQWVSALVDGQLPPDDVRELVSLR